MGDKKVYIYDTTLRDGAQSAMINFSIEDKLLIAKKLDRLGVDYIEGGWPVKGVNAKDFEFFKRAGKLKLKKAKLAAFGSTRRAKNAPKNDPGLNSLLESGTKVITIFGKSWALHAEKVIKVSLGENLRMIRESVSYLKDRKKEVIFDAEHFFDGYRDNAEYALATLKAAEEAGADCVCLCDTNGGTLPAGMEDVTKKVRREIRSPLGIHAHNDSELAVANSLIAVNNGFNHVQGTLNGFGERTGNANLVSIIASLSLKMGRVTVPKRSLKKLTEASHYVYEIANVPPDEKQPFTGKDAFTHKGGVHANAVMKFPAAYEHIEPALVGNERTIPVTDQAGVSSLKFKAKELGFNLYKDEKRARNFILQIKKMEQEGYEFEGADASLVLFLKKQMEGFTPFFDLKGLRVIDEEREGELFSEATIKIKVKNRFEHTAAEGNGPVNALDMALRKALVKFYPGIKDMHLVDFKVRVIEGSLGTASKVRVLIESSDKKDAWNTMGVSENIIEASWKALTDSVEYKLLKDRGKAGKAGR